jgi:hypothetical protein
MDFIERIFGLSPDNGSGSLELALTLIPLVGIIAIRAWRNRSAWSINRHSNRTKCGRRFLAARILILKEFRPIDQQLTKQEDRCSLC